MVYGLHARAPVYKMQELMRLINEEEPDMQARVDNTKLILADLPPTNLRQKRVSDLYI